MRYYYFLKGQSRNVGRTSGRHHTQAVYTDGYTGAKLIFRSLIAVDIYA